MTEKFFQLLINHFFFAIQLTNYCSSMKATVLRLIISINELFKLFSLLDYTLKLISCLGSFYRLDVKACFQYTANPSDLNPRISKF